MPQLWSATEYWRPNSEATEELCCFMSHLGVSWKHPAGHWGGKGCYSWYVQNLAVLLLWYIFICGGAHISLCFPRYLIYIETQEYWEIRTNEGICQPSPFYIALLRNVDTEENQQWIWGDIQVPTGWQNPRPVMRLVTLVELMLSASGNRSHSHSVGDHKLYF